MPKLSRNRVRIFNAGVCMVHHIVKTSLALSVALIAGCATSPPDQGQRGLQDAWQEQLASNPVLLGSEPTDLWERIRTKLAFKELKHPRVEEHIDNLSRHPGYLYTLTEQARPFLHYIVEATERRGFPMEVALVPMVESGFRPTAVSPRNAVGLWQIMPGTARHLGLARDSWYDGRRDVKASTEAALDYLEYLYDYFAGDWLLALAAYNAGEGTVGRAIAANERAGRPTDYWNLNLPRETKLYVPRILALGRLIAEPQVFGLDLGRISNEPYLAKIAVGPQISLSRVALLAGMSEGEVRFFNPCLRRNVTPPDSSYELLLPRENAVALLERMEISPGEKRNTRYQFVMQVEADELALPWWHTGSRSPVPQSNMCHS
jgi:membrane-bound lytic murein transglycosylase D